MAQLRQPSGILQRRPGVVNRAGTYHHHQAVIIPMEDLGDVGAHLGHLPLDVRPCGHRVDGLSWGNEPGLPGDMALLRVQVLHHNALWHALLGRFLVCRLVIDELQNGSQDCKGDDQGCQQANTRNVAH